MNLAYTTNRGEQFIGNAIDLLSTLDDETVDLVITSPPFALLRKKEYGNENQAEYIKWLSEFATLVLKKLKTTGSFVLDLGGAYQKGIPIRSLYNFRVLIELCDNIGFHLAEDFYWFNPSKLPSPIEWVNKKKIRVKDSVNTIWWLSKTPYPKSDVRKVLAPYSERMKKLLKNPEKFFTPKERPSGHNISNNFNDNGGSIPPNLLQIPNTESNSNYLANCKKAGFKGHPARFPSKLPEFFIKFLTDEKDLVVDIFSGSNTTGYVAEQLKRKWISIDIEASYAAMSAFRFLPKTFLEKDLLNIYYSILSGVEINLIDFLVNRQSISEQALEYIKTNKSRMEQKEKLNKNQKKLLENLKKANSIFS